MTPDEARHEVARVTADLSNEVARLRAQVAAVDALCRKYDEQWGYDGIPVHVIRAHLAEAGGVS